MRQLREIAVDLRAEAPCIAGGHSAPCSDCSLMIEAAEALEMIDKTNGVKLRNRLGQSDWIVCGEALRIIDMDTE